MFRNQLIGALANDTISIDDNDNLYFIVYLSENDYLSMEEGALKAQYIQSSTNINWFERKVLIKDHIGQISPTELQIMTHLNLRKLSDMRSIMQSMEKNVSSIERKVKFFYVLAIINIILGLIGGLIVVMQLV